MMRFFIALAGAMAMIAFALFLWQIQLKSYHVSFGKEKNMLWNFGDAIKEFRKSLPPIAPITDELESLKINEDATNTGGEATSTHVYR